MAVAAPAPPAPTDRADLPDCPYVGLVPFDERDAAYFYGRERETRTIVANLDAARLTLLYAPSGVGKSSVLRAGVLPRLRRRAEEDADDEDEDPIRAVIAYVSDWREAPRETVRRAVARAAGADPTAPDDRPGADWLRSLLRATDVDVLYVVLDQFEEYFYYHPVGSAGEVLGDELVDLLDARDLDVHILLAVREDALAGLDRFKGRIPQLFGNYLRLAHLGADAARAAIEGPLTEYNRRAGSGSAMTIEPPLVDALLEQVRTGRLGTDPAGAGSGGPAADAADSIEAPYLQLVLTRIWEHEVAAGSRVLRRATLDDLGGAETIVQSHLDTVVAGLRPGQEPVAAAVFRHLVTASGTKIALSAMELADYADQPEAAVQEVLDSLSAGRRRILRPVPPPSGVAGPPRYEIFHDVMAGAVLEWRRQYVAHERERATKERLVAEREEARTAATTARRRLRGTWIGVGLVLVVSLVAGLLVYGHYLTNRARQQEKLAEAATALAHNPELSLAAAADAYRISPDGPSRSALLAAASAPPSLIVSGPASPDGGPPLIGMKVVDADHVVAVDAHGGTVVVGPDGRPSARTVVSGLGGTVVDFAPAPDASRVALVTDRGALTVVDVPSGRRVDLPSLPGGAWLSWVGGAPDGVLVALGADKNAATFDTRTGAHLIDLPGSNFLAASAADDRHVATSQMDNRLRVWDVRTGQVVVSPPLALDPIFIRMAGSRVVAVTRLNGANTAGATTAGDKLTVWDWTKPSVLQADVPVPSRNRVQAIAVDAQPGVVDDVRDSVLIAFDKSVWQYRLGDGQLIEVLPQQPNWLDDVAVSPDRQWALTAGSNGQVLVWFDLALHLPVRPTYELLADGGSVDQAAFLGDGVVALEDNGNLRWWQLPHAERFTYHHNWVLDLDLSGDGSAVVTASSERRGYVIATADLTKPINTLNAEGPLEAVRFDPTDVHRVIGLTRFATRPEIWQWGAGTRPPPFRFQDAPQQNNSTLAGLAISPDGRTVAAGDNTGRVFFWDAHSGVLLPDRQVPPSGYPAAGIAFDPADPSGRTLAVTAQDGIHLVGPAGGRTLRLDNPTAVRFDARGDRIVAVADGGHLRVWDTATGVVVGDFVAYGGAGFGGPALSPDGRMVAAGTADGLVQVWDLASGDLLTLTRQHGDFVNDVLFAPGGQGRLISASDDTTVAEWSCPACANEGAAIDAARTAAGGR